MWSATSLWVLLRISDYTFNCFFRILSSTRMKFGQITCSIWRLETSPRPFYEFNWNNSVIDRLIFSKCLLFLFVSWHTFKSKNQTNHHYWFKIVSSIKMKLGQLLVKLMTNISNLLLALSWTLDTSPTCFYNFDKMEIWCNLFVLSKSCLLLFPIVSVHTFKRIKNHNSQFVCYEYR